METEPAVLQSLLGCTSVLVKSFHWKAGHCPEAGSGPEHSNNNAHTHPKNHVVEVLVFCMIMVVIEFCVLCIWEDYSFTALFFHGRPARPCRFPHLFEWILPAKIQDLCDICMIYRARSAIVAALSACLQAEASKNRPISRQKSPISSTNFPVFFLSLGRFRRTFPPCSQRKRKL